jgi:hypothetical protein
MTTRDLEDRVRQAWPSPSDGLRERVLTAAALRMAEAKTTPGVALPAPPMSDPRQLHTPVWRTAPALFVFAALIVIASCSGLDIWSGNELDREIVRLQKKYGSLDVATSRVAPVPDSDNRALVVRAAARHAVPIQDRNYHYQFLAFPVPSPVSAELRAFADANRDAIELLDGIRSRHQSNWNEYFQRGVDPPWTSIQLVSHAIFVRSLLDIEAGQPDDAARAITYGLAVAASMRQETATVAQEIRIGGVASVQLKALRQLLAASTPSAPALDQLAFWLAENRKLDPMQLALLAQMKDVSAMFARMEEGDIDLNVIDFIYPMTWPRWPSILLETAGVVGRPFVRTARLRYLRYMDQLLDIQAGPRPRPLLPERPWPQPWQLVDRLVERFTVGTSYLIETGDNFASSLAVAEIAVALRRFKLDRGDYPDDVSALVPGYLDQLPIDPYTGRTPVYARQGSGFLLQGTASTPERTKWLALEWDVKK